MDAHDLQPYYLLSTFHVLDVFFYYTGAFYFTFFAYCSQSSIDSKQIFCLSSSTLISSFGSFNLICKAISNQQILTQVWFFSGFFPLVLRFFVSLVLHLSRAIALQIIFGIWLIWRKSFTVVLSTRSCYWLLNKCFIVKKQSISIIVEEKKTKKSDLAWQNRDQRDISISIDQLLYLSAWTQMLNKKRLSKVAKYIVRHFTNYIREIIEFE